MQNKNYLKGIIGGIICGFVASIPWIALQLGASFMMSMLAALIAYGVNYGYLLFGGRPDDKLPKIVLFTTIGIIVIASLAVVPLVRMMQWGWGFRFDNLTMWYEMVEIGNTLYSLIIAIVFGVLGTQSIVSRLETETWGSKRNSLNRVNEEIGIIIDELYRLGATSEDTAVDEGEIEVNLRGFGRKKRFMTMKRRGIIGTYQGKYYLKEERGNGSWL